MKLSHRVYKVHDGSGAVVFRGSAPEIAAEFFVNASSVYEVAAGKRKRMLGEYTLEYDGEEPYVPKPKEEDWE